MFHEINDLIEKNKAYLLQHGFFHQGSGSYQFDRMGYVIVMDIACVPHINQLTGQQELVYLVVAARTTIDGVVYDTNEFVPRIVLYQILEALKFIFSVPDVDNYIPRAIEDAEHDEQKTN